MFTGIIYYYNSIKGYGTIKPDDAKELLFFHKDETGTLLKIGDRVSFDFKQSNLLLIIKVKKVKG